MTAALLSAAKRVPSGANVRGPTDCRAGPCSGTAAVTGVRADAAAKTRATPAMTAAPFNAFTFMHCLLAGHILLVSIPNYATSNSQLTPNSQLPRLPTPKTPKPPNPQNSQL